MGKSKRHRQNAVNRQQPGKHQAALEGNQTCLMDRFVIFVLSFCAAVVPLLLRLHQIKLDETTSRGYKGSLSYIDVFNHLKSQWLIVALVVLTLYWVIRFLQRRVPVLHRIFIPLGVYTVFVLLSTLFSRFRWISVHGYPDRLEGVFVLLAYIMLAVTGALVLRTERARTVIIVAAMLSSIVLAVLGASQYLGEDFLQTVAGRSLFIPDAYAVLFDKLDFNFGKNVMYVTVYNPNYLGSYSALLLPIVMMLTYDWFEKKRWYAVLGFLFVAANFVLWLGGMSRAGLLGGVVALLFLLVAGLRSVLRHWKATLLMVLLCATIFNGMNHFSEGLVKREFIRTLPSAIQKQLAAKKTSWNPFVLQVQAKTIDKEATASSEGTGKVAATPSEASKNSTEGVSEEPPKPTPLPTPAPTSKPAPAKKPLVTVVTLHDNRFHFETETETVIVVLRGDELVALDENEQVLEYTIKDKEDKNGNIITTATFNDKRYERYSLQVVSGGALFKWYSHVVPLIVSEGRLTVNTREGVYEPDIEGPDSWGFEGNERLASSRGYIWSRTIPLLKNTLFFGTGPDTFAMVFPQNDIAGKINWMSNNNILVDKPHNWYLQMGINTGVISMLGMLVFLAWYLLRGLQIRNEPELAQSRLIHIGVMSGVIGYLVAAVFNDSNVSVSPLFWVMLGVGLSHLVSVSVIKRTKEINAVGDSPMKSK